MKIGMRTGVRVLCAAAFLAAWNGAALAQDAPALAGQLKEGIDLLRSGKAAEANEKFRAVLAADPSSEVAYDLVRTTSSEVFLDMLKARGDAAQVAQRLLSLAHKTEIEKSRDEAAMAPLVAKAVNDPDLMAASQAADQLAAAHGEYAVPALVGFLGSNDVNVRANAVVALTRIGADAVTPLAASLGSGGEMQQRNVAMLLARIGDERAVPALLRAAKGTGAAAQEAAAAAKKLGGSGEPVAAYLALGEKYFRGDPLVVRNFDRATTVWSLVGDKLTGTDVPRFAYHFELAEQCAFDALALSPGHGGATAMIALCSFAEQAAHANLSDESRAVASVQGAAKALESARAVGTAAGADNLLQAFALAVKLKNADAAWYVADAIPSVWGGRAIDGNNPLVAGLANEDRSVRYASAVTLLRLNPAAAFPQSNVVAALAGQAAGERAVQQVLVLDSDQKNAMNAQRALNDAGFHAVAFTSGVDALQAAKATGGYGAIVVRNRLADLTTFQVLDEIGRDFRTSGMKKVVMAEGADAGAAAAEFEKRGISGVCPTAADAPGVVNAVRKAFEGAEGGAGQKRANALSIAASNALAHAHGTAFQLKDAVPGLLAAAAEGGDEAVRLAALGALANCAAADAQDALRGILAKADNSAAVRAGAAGALGRAVRGAAPTKETFDALVAAMGDEDAGVRAAAGAALGMAKLSAEQSTEVMRKRRI